MTEQLASLDSPSCVEVSARVEESGKTQEDDSQLLEGLREGTESAYETLILRFEQPVYNLVCRLLKDPADARDVVQEVFLKVFRKIRAFRGQSSLKTWIYRIAVNEANNHCRWYWRHRRQEVDLEGREEDGRSYRDSIPAPGGSPFDYVLEGEKHTLIEEALSSLSPCFRAVVVLRDIEDLTYEEIAQVLQLPLGTVKSRILRGRDALRKELGRHLEPEPSFQMTPQMVE
jgi:RNA polymerase sigma-70 factor (ECF subfamily)